MEREHIGIAVLPVHKAALRRLAEANGETMAVTLRRLIRDEAKRQGMWPLPEAERPAQEVRRD